ncbi:polysaccharide deacetylase family protein [Dyadobacter sp. LHD-138]|uniref:polysaccharide deacetylase family protein n=1 Tax=Dyadobacter sp. LHD-138 TaxID=3071413 RepID=UPI0027E1CF70|nr:polysaccharide deacetylase family protein [Dyadobacter sp. LHD-138]MDQ6478472.1 polysaccharide deacetylase family protein [Dyadobacter sp. LHD-138]
MKKHTFLSFLVFLITWTNLMAQSPETYAEKLGWPKGAKVIIFHVDDAGMSYSSNQGAIKSIESGIATSCSIMMPCPWAASFTKYAVKNPKMDAGLHLTLTSEWQAYRWPPLGGIKHSPGLVDDEGCMWHEVEDVVKNASADIVEQEIRAQLERALKMGLKPSHMDSHMGTLFAHPPFLERYIKVGVEYGIPVMFPGGNNRLLIECLNNPLVKKLKAEGKWKEGMQLPQPAIIKESKSVGEKIWNAELPVLDDLHTISGDWKPAGDNVSAAQWGKYKAEKFRETITKMQPGVAMMIVHSSDITDAFKHISSSGGSRYADMLSMLDPDLKAFIKSEGVILTTWTEMLARRKQVK